MGVPLPWLAVRRRGRASPGGPHNGARPSRDHWPGGRLLSSGRARRFPYRHSGNDHLVASALHIYLQDHLAGATFGLQLVQRCQRNNEGSEFAEPLAKLTAEIAEDRRTLQAIMRDVGAEASRTKVAAGWTLEKLRRLKPNGRILKYTPLARVVELESLAIGISGKKAMWRALEDVASHEQRLARHDFPALAERADDQSARVEALRLDAARTAFPHARSTEREPRPPSSGRP